MKWNIWFLAKFLHNLVVTDRLTKLGQAERGQSLKDELKCTRLDFNPQPNYLKLNISPLSQNIALNMIKQL